jgi:ubiquinone/menaquinone biosynthesis C-methylase UbiE
MVHSRQQAWKLFWDGTGKSPGPLAAIDFPEVSQQTYRASCVCIQELLDLSADDVVLNIGCGPGLFEEQLAFRVKYSVGLDFSPIMVDKAQRRTSNLHNAFFLQATGTALPFAPTQFNKVLLHYFTEDEMMLLLHEIRRVSQADALVLLGDIGEESQCDLMVLLAGC